jgi:RimJ/RimL family protein N-acetyltransferase
MDIEKHYANLGILIGEKKWQGVGVGPEVIKASAKWLQKEKGIQQIVLRVKIANESAVKAYKKVGFSEKNTPYISKVEGIHLSMVWDLPTL